MSELRCALPKIAVSLFTFWGPLLVGLPAAVPTWGILMSDCFNAFERHRLAHRPSVVTDCHAVARCLK
jgi:hypothetical protein